MEVVAGDEVAQSERRLPEEMKLEGKGVCG